MAKEESMGRIKRGQGSFVATVDDVDGNEHEVTVTYRGYSDPGRTYGPPEECYPPEGEMDIAIDGIPDGVDFGDRDALHQRLEDQAWEHLLTWDDLEENYVVPDPHQR
jgi:hypothetical protein